MEYPSDWKVGINAEEKEIDFYHPSGRCHISIWLAGEFERGDSSEKLADKVEKSLKSRWDISELTRFKSKIGKGKEAIAFRYKQVLLGGKIYSVKALVVAKEDSGYFLAFMALPEEFDKMNKLYFVHMISSFRMM
jgi:hypothetical protein